MWLLNGMLNFLPYLWLVLLLPVVGIAPFRRPAFTLLACVPVVAALVLINSSQMLVASAAGACNESPALRVATANVLMSNDRLAALADDVLAEAPDIVVFEELRQPLEAFSPALAAAYPFRIATDTPWLTLASRLPLEDARRLALADAVPGREPLVATVHVGGRPVTVLAVHAQVPLNRETFRLHREQYALLAREAREATGAVLAVGDFNATVFSPIFANFMVRNGFRSAAGSGTPTHFPRRHFGLRIDHVLVRGADVCGERVFDLTGSDHRGVAVDVRLG